MGPSSESSDRLHQSRQPRLLGRPTAACAHRRRSLCALSRRPYQPPATTQHPGSVGRCKLAGRHARVGMACGDVRTASRVRSPVNAQGASIRRFSWCLPGRASPCMSTWVVRKPTAGAGTTDASSTVWSELYDVAASRSGSLRFSRHVPAPARQLVRRDAARRSIVSNSQTVDALGWCENRVVGIELRAHGGAAQLASQSRQFAAWSHAHAHAHARTHTRTHARARTHLFLKAKPPSNGCCSACGTCLSDGGTEPAFPSDIAMLPTGMTCLSLSGSLSGSLAESVSLSLALSLVCARARVRACACACVCVSVCRVCSLTVRGCTPATEYR
jgi:hypothetical protein